LLPTVAIENAKNDNLLFVSFGTREKIGLELCVARRRRPRAAVTSLIGCGESEGIKNWQARARWHARMAARKDSTREARGGRGGRPPSGGPGQRGDGGGERARLRDEARAR
jgi:hypothetical protein